MTDDGRHVNALAASTLDTARSALLQLAEAASVDTPSAEDALHGCPPGWGFALNPDVVPEWLISATAGKVKPPFMRDLPWVARTEEYIDWPGLLAEHPNELVLAEELTPTGRCLEITEELRQQGLDASIGADLDLQHAHGDRLIFGIQASAILVNGDNVDDTLRAYENDLHEAMKGASERHHVHPEFYESDVNTPAVWAFC